MLPKRPSQQQMGQMEHFSDLEGSLVLRGSTKQRDSHFDLQTALKIYMQHYKATWIGNTRQVVLPYFLSTGAWNCCTNSNIELNPPLQKRSFILQDSNY